MKVVHLISGGDTGGAKTHIHSLLAKIGTKVDITMVCFMEGPFAEEARAMGIPTVVFPGNNIFKTLKLLKAFIREGGYDIIHCHGSRGNMMGAMLRRSLKLPLVTTVHSDYKLDYLGRPLGQLTYGNINKVALRRMDYHIGVSDAMSEILIDRGFDANRVFTIYNGIDFTPKPPTLSREEYLRSVGLSFEEDSIIVGIAARLDPVKDVGTLIRAFAKAHAQCPRLRLVVAGAGQQMEEFQALIRELRVEGKAVMAGWVSDMPSFYGALDINTLTSLSETFPYSVTEGARAGLPIVSSRVGGVPYLVEHGVTGLLFEAQDVDTLAKHLVTLAENPEMRERLGRNLQKKGREEYSIEKTVDTQVGIYESILRRQTHRKERYGAVVCGAYGKGNAGDDAILEAIVKELRDIDADIPVTVLSRTPKKTRRVYRVDALYTFNLWKFARALRKSKLYINGGGSLMQDVTSRRSLWFYLLTLSMAHRRRNAVMMYGCGIGPIRYASNRKRAARVMEKNVDIITLRDPNSLKELEDMKVTGPEIILSADPTVTLPAAPREVTDGLLENCGMDRDGAYICFTLRPWPGYEKAVPAFAQAARYAWEKYQLTPVFLPIEARLDRTAAEMVTRELGDVPHFVMDQPASSYHAIGLFARMRAVVSMRLHALVFAAGQGVPLVGVVYDQKVSSFLDYIGQDLYVDLSEVSGEKLCALIDKAAARGEDKQFLLSGVERLRAVEGHNSEAAARLLEGVRR